jgi:[acyl-carrier-protein] S-malonyltransferase
MSTALLFPGQGSQRVGMGRDLAHAHEAARRVYEEADEVLGLSLSKLCWDGPEDALTLTRHAQPAILATSVAVFRVLSARGLAFDVVAGHSLGEWTALVAAGAMTLRDAVRLTHLRGTYMQDAVPVGQGAMAAIMGLDLAKTQAVCAEASTPGEPVEPANLNGSGQIVISGHTAAVDRAIPLASAAGAKLAKKLTVSAPFHCSLMKPAADRLAVALADVAVTSPRVPVIANVNCEPHRDESTIRRWLTDQLTQPVRWQASMEKLIAEGVERFIEIGPGRVLTGLMKKISRQTPVVNISTAESLRQSV